MTYDILKVMHIVGVVLLVGNVTITAFWKVIADRTGDVKVVSYAQHLVILCDWIFTLLGIVFLTVGGYGMAVTRGFSVFGESWLIFGQLLFLASGIIWMFILIPLQVRQGRQAKLMKGSVPPSYWRDSRLWLIWGIIATVPLVGAIYVMVAKP